jgi:hypothetical protein
MQLNFFLIQRFIAYLCFLNPYCLGQKKGLKHRWALIRYFVISLPLVTIVSQ